MAHTRREQADLPEFIKAADRIGHSSSEVMNWIVRFAQTPLADLSEGDFRNLAAELFVFTNGPRGASNAVVQHKGRPGMRIGDWPNRAETKELQALTLARIEELLNDGASDFHFGGFRLFIHLNKTSTGTVMFPIIGTQVEGFAYYFAHILGKHAHQIGRCPECTGLYVGIRLHQKFCSPRCRSRAATREFRKRESKGSKKSVSR